MARQLILRHRLRWPLLVLAVVLAHLGAVDHLAATVADWSAAAALPPRLQVAFVREMVAAEPIRVAVAPPRAAPRQSPRSASPSAPPRVAGAAPQASDPASSTASPDLAASQPGLQQAAEAVTVSVAEAPAVAPEPIPPVVAASAAGAEAAASVPAFRWPASTRLSYRLSGQYRGEVHGQAQVEWILDAPRYQVNLDVQVGMPIAPLFSRQMRSDGVLSAAGLHPRRYDEDNKMAFRDRQRVSIQIDEAGVTLANGLRWARPLPDTAVPALPGALLPESPVQDSASQFVQLSYLFTVDPQRLEVGNQITLPLALPRRVEPWVYQVVAEETLDTPFGPVETFHVRPHPDTRRGRDLLAEAWFAPRWGYLPVRIRIEQDTEVFVDLLIERKPELAGP